MVGAPPIVVHYWADLQSVHGFRCYDNMATNAKCERVPLLPLCLVYLVDHFGRFDGRRRKMEGFVELMADPVRVLVRRKVLKETSSLL